MSKLEYMQDLERQLSEAQQRSAKLMAENESWQRMQIEAATALKQAEAALAERDRMLAFVNPWRRQENKDQWLADLRGRAKEGRE